MLSLGDLSNSHTTNSHDELLLILRALRFRLSVIGKLCGLLLASCEGRPNWDAPLSFLWRRAVCTS